MTSIRRNATALFVAAALSLPTLASAEQGASELCEGDKAEQKQPHAEREKQASEKSDQKSDPKSRTKQDDKSTSNRPDTTS
jgi:hypothetical protein